MYEGLPIRPDAGIWWKIVEENKVNVDVLVADRDPRAEEAGPGVPARSTTLSSLRHLFLAGEPLDEPTHRWMAEALGKPRHRQLLADRDRLADPERACPGVEDTPRKFGRPRFPVYGYDVRLLREDDGAEVGRRTRKACVAIVPPLPPGLHDARSGATTSASSRPISRRSRAS